MIARRFSDTFGQVLQVDPWARGLLQLLGDGIEVFDGQGARECVVDQCGDCLAGLMQCFCKALHQRLLVEFGCGQGQSDRYLLAGAGFRRIAAGQRELAKA